MVSSSSVVMVTITFRSMTNPVLVVLSELKYGNFYQKEVAKMAKDGKRYHVKSACPQCGCSFAQVLSKDEIRKRYGDMPNVELECGECMTKFQEDMKTACPEWDKDCKLED
jgi:hypothetical protein